MAPRRRQRSAISRQLFEHAGPLLDRLAEGEPYGSPEDLLARASEILRGLSDEDKVAVINAHPRIGDAPDRVKARSPASFREQGYDGDTTPPQVMDQLTRLNDVYERRFGFRFVVFVNRRPKAQLVPVLERRLERSRIEEMETALSEILAIAQDRLARGGGGA